MEEWGQQVLRQLYDGGELSQQQSQQLIESILTEKLSPVQSGAILALLSQRGESETEVAGALEGVAKVMKPLDLRADLPAETLFYDVVGTGGDGKNCVNLSSAVAVCLAALGLACAKHGNRAQSGLLGSADIFELCRVPIELSGEAAQSFFRSHNFLYLFAPRYHPSFRHAAPIRRALKLPTIFNLLGPLSNPSRPPVLAVGASSLAKARLLSKAAALLGRQRVFCYASADGYDEVSTAATTQVFVAGELVLTVSPEDFFSRQPMPRVESAEQALASFRLMLSGQDQPLARLLALNLALCLHLFRSQQLQDAYREAWDFVRSGEGLRKLESLQL